MANLTAAHPSANQRCSSAPRREFVEDLQGRHRRGTTLQGGGSGLFLPTQAALRGAEIGGRQFPPISRKIWFCHLSKCAKKWIKPVFLCICKGTYVPRQGLILCLCECILRPGSLPTAEWGRGCRVEWQLYHLLSHVTFGALLDLLESHLLDL